jgi:hypothetical protein
MRKLLTLLAGLSAMALSASAQTVTLSLVTQPCASNGLLQATATGFSGSVTYNFYSWTSGASLATNTTGTLSSYTGERIRVYATAGTQSATATYNGAPPFTYTSGVTAGVCPANGSAALTITGGTAPYSIEWRVAGTTPVISTSNPASLPPNKYDVTITDAAGCKTGTFVTHDSLTVGYTVPFTYTKSSTQAACTNGSATISGITGGTAPYAYLWSNSATTSSVTGLSRGYYFVTITDASGCSANEYFDIRQNPQITVYTTTTAATCANTNGAVVAFGSGGAAPYTYLWSNAQTTSSISGLSGGTSLSVTATDANGCSGTSYVYVNAATPIKVNYTTTPTSCTAATGTATLSLSGGAAPYSVVWNTTPVQTGTTATGLASGSYSFKVTDANNCQRTGTIFIGQATSLYAYATSTPATCTANNGTVLAIASGGTLPYTYSWNTSATSSGLTGVASGFYSVTVTDAAGCKKTGSVTVDRSTPINLGTSITPASCEFTSDGAATVTATGGTAPYTYHWSGTSATTSSATGLMKGDYAVSVTDAAGCGATSYFPVGYNAADSSCFCTITGTVYNDANHNCVKDAGEAGIPNIQIHCSGRGYAYTNSAGVYSFRVPSGTYTMSQSVQAYYPLSPCQSNAVTVTSVAGTGCVNTVNFADTSAIIHDLSVRTVSLAGPPIPGFNYYQRLIVSNDGTVTENPNVSYKYDNQLGAPTSTSMFYTATGSSMYRNNTSFPTMGAGTVQQSTFGFAVPTTIPINTALVYQDSVVNILPMSNWMNDYTPWNNVSTYNSAVMGSFDPNAKEVSPAGTGAQGLISNRDSVLTYTIHFQNEGNWPASKVVLVDTLDPDFIVTSLKPIAGSHAFKTEVSDGTPNVVRFTFDPIYLPPDAEDHIGSMGYVVYSIRQKPNLPAGTRFENSASIYFDYNAPIKTNTTLNTVEGPKPTGVASVPAGTFDMSVYPNPANSIVRVKIQALEGMNNATIRLVNLVGQSMLQQRISMKPGENIFEANTSNLAAGLYFVEVTDGSRVATQKLSIVK